MRRKEAVLSLLFEHAKTFIITMVTDLSNLVLQYEKYHQNRIKQFYARLKKQPKTRHH